VPDDEDEDDVAEERGSHDGRSSGRSSGRTSKRRSAAWAISVVREQFPDLTGRPVEQVTGVDKGHDSTWTIGVEVVEVKMVPDTADLLAQYDVEVDTDGDVVGYRRIRRYQRGRADD
jgi:hypothetical protein